MSILHQAAPLHDQIQDTVTKLTTLVDNAARQGLPVHVLEKNLWQELLHLGFQYLSLFFAIVGHGDCGDTITTDDGQHWQRLPELHPRRYLSVFGELLLSRVVYGSREGQKIDFVPLDNRVQLPASVYSYLLQDWSQGLCVESAFGQVAQTLLRLLGLKISVDGLEHINADMAEPVEDYRQQRPAPAPDSEGEIMVASADGKGIVMRRSAEQPAPPAHRSKGEPASQKRMATVASVYSVDRHVRTPEAVVAALFRDPRDENAPRPERPQPQHKHVMATLPRAADDGAVQSSNALAHDWLMGELVERNRHGQQWQRPMVFLYDGQESLWDARAAHLPPCGVDILDLLHVTPRLWQAAHVFHKEGSDAATAFVRERCLRVLQGRAEGVIRGLREMGTKRGVKGSKKQKLTKVCNYLENNLARMRYDVYLAEGYPIASGVIEGACRHLVKDRMERAGMHWTPTGAQAMLDVRSMHVDGDWEPYQSYRIERERQRLYPHRHLVEGTRYEMAC